MKKVIIVSLLLVCVMMCFVPVLAAPPSLSKRMNAELDYRNARTPQGYHMGLYPSQFEYMEPESKQGFLSPFMKSLPLSVDYSAKMPPVGDQGAVGSCVCWAAGYYCKSFQEHKQYGWDLSSPSHQMSPYFLWDFGGSGFFDFSGELMMGYGIPTMDSYSYYNQDASESAWNEAGKYKALGYSAFFNHSVSLIYDYWGDPYFYNVYYNNISALKAWLASGDCFVVGIPVVDSFGAYGGGVYDVNIRTEVLLGFHALCVVGYNDYLGAFRVVNSWGTGWGESGYGWVSYNFMRKYATDAWRFYDSTGFSPTPPVSINSTQVAYTKDYTITYTGPGTLDVSNTGIWITRGGSNDTLKIMKQSGVLFSERIPNVKTDGSFAILYSQAPIDVLSVGGILKYLSTYKCSVRDIHAGQLGYLKMIDNPNSTWNFLSWALSLEDDSDYPPLFVNKGPVYNNVSTSHISSSGSPANNANVFLYGVILDDLDAPYTNFYKIYSSFKSYKPAYVPKYLSYAELGGEIDTGNISNLTANGGSVNVSDLIANSSPVIYATGTIFTTSFSGVKFTLPVAGHINGSINSGNTIRTVKSYGGNISGEIYSSMDINNISSLYKSFIFSKYYDSYYGYVYGLDTINGWSILYGNSIAIFPEDDISGTEYSRYINLFMGGITGYDWLYAIAGSDQYGMPNPQADIDYVYGALGVYGDFMAGLDNVGNPTCQLGSIKVIQTKGCLTSLPWEPEVDGNGWSKNPVTVYSCDNSFNDLCH
jgi:hypothetical protein